MEPNIVKTHVNAYRLKHLTILHATGHVDLASSKDALTHFVAGQGIGARSDVVLDLRDGECEMTATDAFKLAEFMALPIEVPLPSRKIAVLIGKQQQGYSSFNSAQFLALCAGEEATMFVRSKTMTMQRNG